MAVSNVELAAYLRSLPLFSLVAENEVAELLSLVRPVKLGTGQVLFREGAEASAMWLLERGTQVSVTHRGRGTSAQPLPVTSVGGGESLGEMSLIDSQRRSATATVVKGGVAYELDARRFAQLRAEGRPVAFKVLRALCQELCRKLRTTTDRIAPSGQTAARAPALPLGPHPEVEELDEFPPFRGMPEVVKLALAQKLRLLDFDQVTPLFAEGEPADAAYFVVRGEVMVGRAGKTLGVHGAGTLLGLVACIDGGSRSASCVATGPTRLLRLAEPDFDALFSTGNRFAFTIVDLAARQLVDHLRHANQLLPEPEESRAGPGANEEELLPEAEILPLEHEMELEAGSADEPLV